MDINRHKVMKAVAGAERFLFRHQDPDGLWRDYMLPPGSSDAWTTACVGWALVHLPTGITNTDILYKTISALHSLRRSRGWGYNHATAADADTTAWVSRFLVMVDDLCGVPLSRFLRLYIGQNGCARTFNNAERFGTWAHDHPDVTPIVGLALVEIGADQSLIERVRQASLHAQHADGAWHSFWWSTDAYATARNLEFLAASGGVPRNVAFAALNWQSNQDIPRTPFEAAHHLMISTTLDKLQGQIVETLLDWQLDDYCWPASRVLMVPSQWKKHINEVPIYEDTKRLMSTAMCTEALKRWFIKI